MWWKLIYRLTIVPRLNYLKKLLPDCKIFPCGSRYVCNPPVLLTDIDFMVLAESDIMKKLADAGFRKTNHDMYNMGYDTNFDTYRRGKINLIVFASKKQAIQWNMATVICKQYNVRWKNMRICTYAALRGEWYPNTHVGDLLKERWPELHHKLDTFNSPYGASLRAMYRAQHELDELGWYKNL